MIRRSFTSDDVNNLPSSRSLSRKNSAHHIDGLDSPDTKKIKQSSIFSPSPFRPSTHQQAEKNDLEEKLKPESQEQVAISLVDGQPLHHDPRFDEWDKPFWKIPKHIVLKEAWIFFKQSFALVLSMAANVFIILINFIYIGFLEDELILASFGLGVSYIFFMFLSINLSSFEVLGIYASRNYGALDYKKCSNNLYQGFFLCMFYILFYCMTFLFSEYILLAIRVDPINASLTSYMLKFALPGCILQAINDQFKAFAMSQGITVIFGAANLIAIIVNVVCGYIFVINLGYGVLGFGICKIIMEIINSIVIVFIMVTQVNRETFQKFDKTLFFSDLKDYLKNGQFIAIGCYVEIFCFEINTWMASLTYNQIQISAFVSLVNVSCMHYVTGLGISNALRTNVANLIGQNKQIQAKNLSWFYQFCIFIFAFVEMIVLFTCRGYLAAVYTPQKDVSIVLQENIAIYSICCIPELLLGSLTTIQRLAGNMCKIIVCQTFSFLLCAGVMGSVLCFYCGYGVPGLVWGIAAAAWICNFIYQFIMVRIDWEKITLKEE